MYKFNKIRHDILIQCYGNYTEMKKIDYKLEIDILRNSSQMSRGVLRGAFNLRVWGAKKTPRRPAGQDHDADIIRAGHIKHHL